MTDTALVNLATAQIEAAGPEADVDLDATLAGLSVRDVSADMLRAFIDGLGLRYFSGWEVLLLMQRVHRSGVRNRIAPREVWANLAVILAVANRARHRVGRLRLTSCYRAPAYNEAVGGGSRSTHRDGIALDLVPLDASVKELAAVVRELRGERFSVLGKHVVVPYASRSLVQPGGLNLDIPPFPRGRTAFEWAGGIGTYAGFVHIDARGRNTSWSK